MRLRAGLVVLGIVIVLTALYFGWRGLDFIMFKDNPAYTIHHVEISTQLAASKNRIVELTGISEGVNIFSFSASSKREELLRNVPNLGDVKITKKLPDTVEIVAIDRLPVVRLESTNFASDRKGTVMTIDASQRKRWSSLPVLMDGNEKINVTPGETLTGKNLLALSVINVYNEMDGISFRIDNIDIGGRIYLILQTSDGQREIRLVWDELETSNDIRMALRMASEALAQPKAASLIRFDVLLSTLLVYGI